jgi:hypothetical protein
MLAAMDFDQLKTDLQGLTRMAEASRERLSDLASLATAVRRELEARLAEAEPVPEKSPPKQD